MTTQTGDRRTAPLAATFECFFKTKTSCDVDGTMSYFAPELATYTDATLGWDSDSFQALRNVWEQYMQGWAPPARSYATGIPLWRRFARELPISNWPPTLCGCSTWSGQCCASRASLPGTTPWCTTRKGGTMTEQHGAQPVARPELAARTRASGRRQNRLTSRWCGRHVPAYGSLQAISKGAIMTASTAQADDPASRDGERADGSSRPPLRGLSL